MAMIVLRPRRLDSSYACHKPRSASANCKKSLRMQFARSCFITCNLANVRPISGVNTQFCWASVWHTSTPDPKNWVMKQPLVISRVCSWRLRYFRSCLAVLHRPLTFKLRRAGFGIERNVASLSDLPSFFVSQVYCVLALPHLHLLPARVDGVLLILHCHGSSALARRLLLIVENNSFIHQIGSCGKWRPILLFQALEAPPFFEIR